MLVQSRSLFSNLSPPPARPPARPSRPPARLSALPHVESAIL